MHEIFGEKRLMWPHANIKTLNMNHNNGDNQNKQKSFMLQCMMGGFTVQTPP